MQIWFVPFLALHKKHVAPGHEVVEMGLVKLYRITGKKEYLQTAKFFIEERGHYKAMIQQVKMHGKMALTGRMIIRLQIKQKQKAMQFVQVIYIPQWQMWLHLQAMKNY